jgi:hypothetical protein
LAKYGKYNGMMVIVAVLSGLAVLSTPLPQKASAICESVEPGNRDIKPGADVCQNKIPEEVDRCNIVQTPQNDPSQKQTNISCNKGKG